MKGRYISNPSRYYVYPHKLNITLWQRCCEGMKINNNNLLNICFHKLPKVKIYTEHNTDNLCR